MSKNIAAVVSKMVSDLGSLKTDEERERAIGGARAVLGMNGAPLASSAAPAQAGGSSPMQDAPNLAGISNGGAAWMKRAGLTSDNLEQHYHVDGGKVVLIGEAIGRGKREQSINTYLLTGVAALLETGKPDFSDQTARDYCTQLGCYDPANHAGTLGQFGNRLTGTKKAGWKVTTPGLTAVAAILKPAMKELK